ncbi:hypothetical protein KEM54_004124 [Ascosphaera aggregata]|nr:hypothetical protein KEM54_004124 [Ascosphaera aggregata]
MFVLPAVMDWERKLDVEEAMGIEGVEGNGGSNNDDDIEEIGRGRSVARSNEKATNSWMDFAKVTRADEKRLSVELQASQTIEKTEAWSSTNETPASAYSVVPEVTIKQLSKRLVSPHRIGVPRFRYEASYTVTHSQSIEIKSKDIVTTGDLLDDFSAPDTKGIGFVEGPAMTDNLIGDLIEL